MFYNSFFYNFIVISITINFRLRGGSALFLMRLQILIWSYFQCSPGSGFWILPMKLVKSNQIIFVCKSTTLKISFLTWLSKGREKKSESSKSPDFLLAIWENCWFYRKPFENEIVLIETIKLAWIQTIDSTLGIRFENFHFHFSFLIYKSQKQYRTDLPQGKSILSRLFLFWNASKVY